MCSSQPPLRRRIASLRSQLPRWCPTPPCTPSPSPTPPHAPQVVPHTSMHRQACYKRAAPPGIMWGICSGREQWSALTGHNQRPQRSQWCRRLTLVVNNWRRNYFYKSQGQLLHTLHARFKGRQTLPCSVFSRFRPLPGRISLLGE